MYRQGSYTQAEIARSLASEAHAGQADLVGRPYIEHPQRVARSVRGNDDCEAAAWLHECLEHTDLTTAQMRSQGIKEAVITAVETLTRWQGQTTEEYLRVVKANPIALAVKIADMDDNTEPERLQAMQPQDREQLTGQYLVYLTKLLNVDSRTASLMLNRTGVHRIVSARTAVHNVSDWQESNHEHGADYQSYLSDDSGYHVADQVHPSDYHGSVEPNRRAEIHPSVTERSQQGQPVAQHGGYNQPDAAPAQPAWRNDCDDNYHHAAAFDHQAAAGDQYHYQRQEFVDQQPPAARSTGAGYDSSPESYLPSRSTASSHGDSSVTSHLGNYPADGGHQQSEYLEYGQNHLTEHQSAGWQNPAAAGAPPAPQASAGDYLTEPAAPYDQESAAPAAGSFTGTPPAVADPYAQATQQPAAPGAQQPGAVASPQHSAELPRRRRRRSHVR